MTKKIKRPITIDEFCGKPSGTFKAFLASQDYFDAIIEKSFAGVRKRVQKAVDASPKSVRLEDALKQVEQFRQKKNPPTSDGSTFSTIGR